MHGRVVALAVAAIWLGCAVAARAGGGETCATATPITSLPFMDSGDTTSHADDRSTLPVMCALSAFATVGGPDVVYSFDVGPGNALTISVTPTAASYDPAVYLYQGCGAGEMCVDAKDDGDVGVAETLSPSGLAAGTYFIWIDAFYPTAPSGAGPYTLSVTGNFGAVSTTTTTTSQSPPTSTSPTTTTLRTGDSTCIGGSGIDKARAKVGKTFVIGGTLDTTAVLDPIANGAQLLIEDLGGMPHPLLDLTAATTPIPPGARGTGCGPKDGWKTLAYTNRSGSLAPPSCPAGSAIGLASLRFKDRRAKGGGIVFHAQGRGTALGSPTGPLRVTLVLSAGADAGLAGECGSHAFATSACRRKRSGLRCK